MESFVADFLRLFTDTQVVLKDWMDSLGLWLYVILFVIIFCETGLVVTPFLPGDSLLFAVGTLAAIPGSPVSLWMLIPLLILAAVAGDGVNYWIGYLLGPKVFQGDSSWLLNRKHLLRAQAFYQKHGGKAIVLARFAPIVRTFAPFVAGIGKMSYGRFWVFNVIGGIAWVTLFLVAGRLFAEQPFVKRHFQLVIFGIIFVSVLPIAWEWWASRRRAPVPAIVAEPARESA